MLRSLILSITLFCASLTNAEDFNFVNAGGCQLSLAMLGETYQRCYGEFFTANVVLVVATQEGETNLRRQIDAIYSQAEPLRLMIVTGYDYKVDQAAYHVDEKVTKTWLAGEPYAIYLFNEKAEQVLVSNRIVNAALLKRALDR